MYLENVNTTTTRSNYTNHDRPRAQWEQTVAAITSRLSAGFRYWSITIDSRNLIRPIPLSLHWIPVYTFTWTADDVNGVIWLSVSEEKCRADLFGNMFRCQGHLQFIYMLLDLFHVRIIMNENFVIICVRLVFDLLQKELVVVVGLPLSYLFRWKPPGMCLFGL